MSRLRSFLPLLLLLLLLSTVIVDAEEETCMVGEDGTCQEVEEESSVDETRWGVLQEVAGDADTMSKTQAVVDKTAEYMENTVLVDPSYGAIREECKNRHKHCAFWATIGECEKNPSYMVLQCAPSCQTCDQILFENRCPYDPNAPTILNPGDLNHLFERLTTDSYYQQYQPVIHSRPKQSAPVEENNEPAPQEGPWVVTLEKFLTDEECDRLIELGAIEGYDLSKDVGAKKFDGTYDAYENKFRTSTNAWCVKSCFEDPLTKQVLDRIENVTGVPDANSEYLQLLRYEVGQFYQVHHDYIPHHVERAEGVRILTVFLYLNDVEAGGGTDFPHLGITVMPKRGKALIWPSVFDENPNMKDGRTEHQALPVLEGLKYGANAWLHQRDFKDAYSRGCQ